MPDLRHLCFSGHDFTSAVGDVPQPLRSEAVPLSGKIARVAKSEIDAYLDGLDEPKRGTLQMLRRTILEIIPEADQGISYGLPAFRLSGKVVAGFAAFKNHLSYLPHSGSVLGELEADLDRYKKSKGALQFSVDQPLPKQLVKKLIAVRREQAGV
jgi:uncharacterized protein YdhG (YjbR/CyaY superfamily)